MTHHSNDLVDRLATPEETGLDPALLVPLLGLLAAGDPVDVATLAATTGRTVEQVTAQLARVPDTEYDDQGRIVGQGLSLRPTAHRFTVDGHELYTWCALDTLIFPTILDRAARVESTSPASGQRVQLTASPTGVTEIEPATAVVSLVNPEDMTEIRSSFCNQVHFFTSTEDAQPWLDSHPDGEVLAIADAFRLGAELTTGFLAQLPTPAAEGHGAVKDCCR